MPKTPASHPEFDIGYDAAVHEVLYFLRCVDWQEDTAADAVEAQFCRDATPAGQEKS